MMEILVQNARHNTYLVSHSLGIISSGYKEEKEIGSDTEQEGWTSS